MEFLVSQIDCLGSGYRSLEELFDECITETQRLTIAVGYASALSLGKLDHAIRQNHVEHVDLILGMYYSEGIPDSIYGKAISVAEGWDKDGLGHVYLTVPVHYHGKVYLFEKRDGGRQAVIGSANLTEISPPAGLLQCEAAIGHDDAAVIRDVESHLVSLKPYLVDIREAHDMSVIRNVSRRADDAADRKKAKPTHVTISRTPNAAMEKVKGIEKISEASVSILRANRTGIRFDLPLKVPTYAQRFSNDRNAYAHSNINVCYSKPRNPGGKGRNWYEFQLTVSSTINRRPGYPAGKERFFVVTDDGWKFLAHVAGGDGDRKQFSAVGNELLLGTWVKGRLASFGLVTPQPDTLNDPERKGLITREMLDDYGCDAITIEKTNKTLCDGDGNWLAVWLMTFLPESTKKAIENT